MYEVVTERIERVLN
jgi:hypothetical protein